jgi:tetratricopeptide (TPR) repeat protein
MKHTCRLVEIGLALILSIGHSSPAQQPVPAKTAPSEGRTLIQEQAQPDASLASAEAHLRSQLKDDPESASLLYQLGLVLGQENKPRESLEIYTHAAQKQKPDATQLRSVALDYVLLGSYDNAIHWLQVALPLDPGNVDVIYSLGRCLYTQGRYHEAEASYLNVLQLSPRHLKAEENLGLTYLAENEPQKAEEALRTAAAWAAEEPSPDEWPFLDLGTLLLDQDRPVEATPFLRRAAAVAPDSAVCHEKLGRALVAGGSLNDGISELQAAIKLDPKNPKLHFELGHAYRQAGEQTQAAAEFALSKTLYGGHQQD